MFIISFLRLLPNIQSSLDLFVHVQGHWDCGRFYDPPRMIPNDGPSRSLIRMLFFGVPAESSREMVPGRLQVACLQDRRPTSVDPSAGSRKSSVLQEKHPNFLKVFHQRGCCLVWFWILVMLLALAVFVDVMCTGALVAGCAPLFFL